MNNDEIRAAVTELTMLEKFSPYILDSFLRARDWEKSFDDFYRVNCPRFQGFRAARESNASGGSTDGRGFDLHMQIVHNEYLCSLESLVTIQLQRMDVSVERFMKAVSNGLESSDSVPKGLVNQLKRFEDFFLFGEMMEDKFKSIFLLEEKVTATRQMVSASDCALPVYTRVLWDIENIGVPKRLGGMKTVQRLLSFLRKQRLAGDGVDCRITAFFNPAGRAVGKAAVQELDKAAVEMVWVSGKREDADRKLGNRLLQETQVLLPASAAFVIITSDLDFRHHFQHVSAKGFQLVVVHKAQTDGGVWTEALALHAAKAFHWDEVIREESTARPSLLRIAEVCDRKSSEAGVSAPQKETDERRGASDRQESTDPGNSFIDWIPAVCKSWNSARGFGLFSLTAPASDPDLPKGDDSLLVFAHTTVVAWPVSSDRSMQPGDAVELTLQQQSSGARRGRSRGGIEKQPRASALRLVTAPSHPEVDEASEENGPVSDPDAAQTKCSTRNTVGVQMPSKTQHSKPLLA